MSLLEFNFIVLGMPSEDGYEKNSAKVPLAEMNKYSTSLSPISGGRAIYHMSFSDYAAVPGDLQIDLLKAYEEEEKED